MSVEEIVVVVDDDDVVRTSLQLLLKSAGFSVRLYGSAAEFIAHCPHAEQGCLLLDVQMPDMDGLALQEKLATGWPLLSVVILTGHGNVSIAVRAMKGGAVDFIEKPFDREILLDVVHHAVEHSRRIAAESAETNALTLKLRLLSKREREILEGLVSGLRNKAIAYDLGISPRTVEIYRGRLTVKMHAHSVSELIHMATMAGVHPK